MPVETGEWIGDFDPTSPTNGEAKKQGDDHFRLMKEWIQNSLAGWPGLVLGTGTEAQGATVNDFVLTMTPTPSALTTGIVVFKATHTNTGACTLQINALTAKTLKDMDGGALANGDITSGALVAAYYDGTDFLLLSGNDRAARNGDTYTGTQDFTGATITVTTQSPADNTTKAASTAYTDAGLALKANLASPALTGVPTAPTASVGASGTQLATLDFVIATSLVSALPGQTGNAGKLITTDGTNGSWTDTINATVTGFGDGVDITKRAEFVLSGITTATTRTLTVRDENITLAGATTTDALKIYDYTDPTKITKFQNSGYTTATTRTVTLADEDVSVFTPYAKLLSTVTASNSATVDIETTFNSTYDMYIIEASGVTVQTNGVSLESLFKIGGSYVTANYNGTGTNIVSVSGGAAAIVIDNIPNAASAAVNFTARIPVPASTAFAKGMYFVGAVFGAPTAAIQLGGAMTNSDTGALTGIRFQASSGNIVAGKFRLYGVRNS